ncbi:MAG: hypothetical protein AAGG51_26655 [Cyanobacteria bacterium P01_G01_bin.54]
MTLRFQGFEECDRFADPELTLKEQISRCDRSANAQLAVHRHNAEFAIILPSCRPECH